MNHYQCSILIKFWIDASSSRSLLSSIDRNFWSFRRSVCLSVFKAGVVLAINHDPFLNQIWIDSSISIDRVVGLSVVLITLSLRNVILPAVASFHSFFCLFLPLKCHSSKKRKTIMFGTKINVKSLSLL